MEALLANGANIDAQDQNGGTALVLASGERNNTEIVHYLLNRGASTDSPIGEKALGLASGRGLSEIVQILLDRRVNVDATCDWNYLNQGTCTALIRALAHQHYETADLLVKSGADVNGRSFMGDRDDVLLEYVIVDKNLRWHRPGESFEDGSENKLAKVVRFLIEHGADPKLVNTENLDCEAKRRYDELFNEQSQKY